MQLYFSQFWLFSLLPPSVISYHTLQYLSYNYFLKCLTLRQKTLLNNSAKPAKILNVACFVFNPHFYSDRAKMRGERETVIIHFSTASGRSIMHSLILLESKAKKV